MTMLTNKMWWYAAFIRALKTLAQVVVASIGTTAIFTGVDWAVVGGSAGLAFVLSLFTSLAGLPEVECEEK
jgi:hypothetical protein